MTWRYKLREMGERERANALLHQIEGRLTYKALIAWQARNPSRCSTSKRISRKLWSDSLTSISLVSRWQARAAQKEGRHEAALKC